MRNVFLRFLWSVGLKVTQVGTKLSGFAVGKMFKP